MTQSTVRAKYLFTNVQDRAGYQEIPLASATKDGVTLRSELALGVWNPGDDISNYKIVRPEEFVIGLRSFQHGIVYSGITGLVSPAYTVLRPTFENDAGFYRYYLKSGEFIARLDLISSGIRQGRTIKYEDFGELHLPVPRPDEQRRIADFLDAETARIDALGRLRQRQAGLVSERWEAAIQTNIQQMKAPTVQLRHLGTRVTTGPFGTVFAASEYQSSGIPMVNPTHIRDGRIIPDDHHLVSSETAHRLTRHKLRSGDLVVGRKGDIGRSALVLEAQDGWICGSDSIALHPSDRVRPRYLAYLLRSTLVRSQLLANSLAATMPSLSEGNLLGLRIPLVSLANQDAVVTRLDDSEAWTSRIADRTKRQLQLLQERRQALITAAVTGQIDVSTASGRGLD